MQARPRRVGALTFSVMPLDSAVDAVLACGAGNPSKGRAVHFANAYNVALASRNLDYARVVNLGDLVFSDGTPITWAGKWIYGPGAEGWERVYGPDVLAAVLERTNTGPEAPGHYFLGGTPECLDALRNQIKCRWPNTVIAGYESPPFRLATPQELLERDKRIVDSGASFVWVGLGTPKQDYEVRRLADAVPVTAIAVGAAFDFLAGTVKQAPVWMQKSGLEWAYRFAQEPRRLAKRYVWGNPVFVREVLRQRFVQR